MNDTINIQDVFFVVVSWLRTIRRFLCIDLTTAVITHMIEVLVLTDADGFRAAIITGVVFICIYVVTVDFIAAVITYMIKGLIFTNSHHFTAHIAVVVSVLIVMFRCCTGQILKRRLSFAYGVQIATETGQQGRNSRPARAIIPGHGGT